jgi:hypothetical protein
MPAPPQGQPGAAHVALARAHIPEHQLQEQCGTDSSGELDHPVRHRQPWRSPFLLGFPDRTAGSGVRFRYLSGRDSLGEGGVVALAQVGARLGQQLLGPSGAGRGVGRGGASRPWMLGSAVGRAGR